jgi:hypothetical protein
MLTRTRRRALVALVPLAVVPVLVAATHDSRHLTTLSCGQPVSTNTTLAADLGPCNGTGVTIDMPNVTLNLNGHRILGMGNDVGVRSIAAGVVVQNGSVSGFNRGVQLFGASNRVLNVRVSGSSDVGILVVGQGDVISGNRVFGNAGGGIFSTGGSITNNILQSNGVDGIHATAATSISGNKALNNGASGILFAQAPGSSLTITNNVANGNHAGGLADGGSADPTAVTLSGNKAFFNTLLGIQAAPGVTDGGNNKADSNGTAAQCTNVVCS